MDDVTKNAVEIDEDNASHSATTSEANDSNPSKDQEKKPDAPKTVSIEEHLEAVRQAAALRKEINRLRKAKHEKVFSDISSEEKDVDEEEKDDETKSEPKQDSSELSRMKVKQSVRAWSRFASEYPDYSSDKDIDGDRKEELLKTAKQFNFLNDAFDSEDYLEAFRRAYAVIHSEEILAKEKKLRVEKARVRMDQAESDADIGSINSERQGSRGTDIEITDADKREARKLGKTPEEYARLRLQFERSRYDY
jgi:hypothetical protein